MNPAATAEQTRLLERFHARSPRDDGAFVVGVLTTGIYCLPSCRARSPKPENVRLFADEEAARAAGLRACKRCRPDHFYRRFDPERERVRALAARVRRDPAAFADGAALAAEAGIGATKCNALFRTHYHLTPAAFLTRARVRHAMEHLSARPARAVKEGGADPGGVLAAGEASGFESASAFHENFRAETGLTPGAYRQLGASGFELQLPADAHVDDLARYFGRDPEGRTERVRGDAIAKALRLDGTPAVLELAFGDGRVRVTCATSLSRAGWTAAHAALVRWLGFESDAAGFERRAARSRDVARLVRGRTGLRIARSSDAFEGLVWVVVGAQVNVAFAAVCRAALVELCGTRVGDFIAHPTPEQVAALDYSDLVKRKYSRRKAEYLIDAARAITAGTLELEDLRHEPATLARERLSEVRGLGPWSVQYLLMRSFGFEDCAPAGDVALAAALQRFFALDERPDPDQVTELMQPFAPHRSLATYHLWKTL